MSGTSPNGSRSRTPYPTRAVGIIKNHALKHRLTIERRIVEAGFDIIKERQMQFNPDTDREVLEELFGADAAALGEEPVWVYVLERQRAIEVLHSLVGDHDPSEARLNTPNSLRAVYGVDLINNAFGYSQDVAAAEVQIASLFASSPPFPTSELPSSPGREISSMRSANSAVLAALRNGGSYEQTDAAQYATSVRTSGSSKNSASGTPNRQANGKPAFKARPVPSTNAVPSVQPRMSKAAALRMGLVAPTSNKMTTNKPRESLSVRDMQRAFMDVPGHKRSSAIIVASTAPPVVAPRATRASQLREGKPVAAPARPRQSVAKEETFKNVPGHKRSETLEVASVKAPVLAPRTNRSASLRVTKDNAPPSSFMFKTPVPPKIPGLLSRSSSSSLTSDDAQSRPAPTRSASVAELRTPGLRPPSTTPRAPSTTPRAPDIAPRSNRSALLRAAQKAQATSAKAMKA